MADRMIPMDWDEEDTYWRTNYRNRPYAAAANREYQVLPARLPVRC